MELSGCASSTGGTGPSCAYTRLQTCILLLLAQMAGAVDKNGLAALKSKVANPDGREQVRGHKLLSYKACHLCIYQLQVWQLLKAKDLVQRWEEDSGSIKYSVTSSFIWSAPPPAPWLLHAV